MLVNQIVKLKQILKSLIEAAAYIVDKLSSDPNQQKGLKQLENGNLET
jgi:hypothetical protein